MSYSDTRFFTNTDTDSLYNRFSHTIKHSQYFDILVGYFRTSGFYKLYTELETVEKIRILVGLNVDKKTVTLIDTARQQRLNFEANQKCRDNYSEILEKEIECSEDTLELEIAAQKFIEFIKSGKLEIRVHPSQNIHAKLYIHRFQPMGIDFGRVITGSSNFSENGLIAQYEFNVELKDRSDVEFALNKFENLWLDGIDVSNEYVDTIQTKTWLSNDITPYDIYLKFLYEYFKEDINIDNTLEFDLPAGFMELDYQKQAINSAKRILDAYNGLFLSDVVGLGKTFMTAMLLQKLDKGKKLIICPPVLSEYWEDTLESFHVKQHSKVVSLGKLEAILKKGTEDYKYIIVDEAHRFRNEKTQSYENLHTICKGKKVILLSATPLNNRFSDLKAQIGLFQSLNRSHIPNITNLEHYFKVLQRQVDDFDKGSPEHQRQLKVNSEKIRDQVLKHIMVRRTRSEIKNFFKQDIERQGLKFPDIADPKQIIYKFDDKTDAVFTQTLKLLKEFKYARYTPLLFLIKPLSEFDAQSQRNMGGFMKGVLVKRLESSFYAFKNSLARFITSYERFLGMYDTGTIWISKAVDVFDLLDNDDTETLLKLLEQDKADKYSAQDFRNDFHAQLKFDLDILYNIQALWQDIDHDPKLEQFIKELKTNPSLKNKQVLIFSESKETTTYLQEHLDHEFKDSVLSFSSQGGFYRGNHHNNHTLRDIILENYQPKHKNPKDDVKILITTDVLAEGINLHRCNIIINYDLPWNPTKVLQRVGRVNRVGTEHTQIHIFNIFPTAQSDAELGLEDNIKAKLQAFHTILGEDAKYLSDDEEVSTHGLFGDKYFDDLNNKETYQDAEDDITKSELSYLQKIRDIRDNDQKLFEKIKRLPKKARSCRLSNNNNDGLITFFRKGQAKEFVFNGDKLAFLQAVKFFECDADTKTQKIPNDYFDYLNKNKEFLQIITNQDDIEMQGHSPKGKDNGKKIIEYIKSYLKTDSIYTDDEEEFLRSIRKTIEAGDIAKKTLKKINDDIKKVTANNPIRFLQIMRDHIKPNMLLTRDNQTDTQNISEIILSLFLKGNKPQ